MKLSWEDIEELARRMFNVWESGGDLAWAKEVWGYLSKAGLTDEFNFIDKTRVCLRLLILARISEEFSAAKKGDGVLRSISQIAEELWINPLALGVLAADAGVDFESCADELELREACLDAASNLYRAELFKCLVSAYGGEENLYFRLSGMSQNASGDILADPRDSEPTGPNLDAYDFVKNGFKR
jgi:hypothetical protein